MQNWIIWVLILVNALTGVLLYICATKLASKNNLIDTLRDNYDSCSNNHDKYVSEEKTRMKELSEDLEKKHQNEVLSMQTTIDNRDVRLGKQKETIEDQRKQLKAKDSVIWRRDQRITKFLSEKKAKQPTKAKVKLSTKTKKTTWTKLRK